MKKITGTVSAGGEVELDVCQLVAKTSWLSGAKLVPPMILVNEFLGSGIARFDHWQEVQWEPVQLTSASYAELRDELQGRYDFKQSEYADSCKDRIMWAAIQAAHQTGKSVEQLLPLLRRLNLLERLSAVVHEFVGENDGNVVDNDIHEFISSRLSETLKRVQ